MGSFETPSLSTLVLCQILGWIFQLLYHFFFTEPDTQIHSWQTQTTSLIDFFLNNTLFRLLLPSHPPSRIELGYTMCYVDFMCCTWILDSPPVFFHPFVQLFIPSAFNACWSVILMITPFSANLIEINWQSTLEFLYDWAYTTIQTPPLDFTRWTINLC
jgi:hypothetical protein